MLLYIRIFISYLFLILTVRPTNLLFGQPQIDEDPKDIDLFTKQARLQIQARMALAQAKDIAHMQMEVIRNLMNILFLVKQLPYILRETPDFDNTS